MPTQEIKFYFNEDESRPSMAVLEVDGQIHFSSDVRVELDKMTIVTSKTTLPDKINNAERTKELVDLEIYKEMVFTLDTIVYKEILTYTEFKSPFLMNADIE